MKKLMPTEAQEQITVIDWLKLHPVLKNHFCASMNAGKRSLIGGRYLKRQGMVAGVSDLFISYPAGKYHGAWIEMKKRKNSHLSIAQSIWLVNQYKAGYATYVAYGADNAINFIKSYLNIDDLINI